MSYVGSNPIGDTRILQELLRTPNQQLFLWLDRYVEIVNFHVSNDFILAETRQVQYNNIVAGALQQQRMQALAS